MFKITKDTVLIRPENDYPGVNRVFDIFKEDLMKVFDSEPKEVSLSEASGSTYTTAIIAGTFGKGGLIDKLAEKESLSGKREVYSLFTVDDPIPGVKKALVAAGSDKRGTIYGLFEISRLCGVSPFINWSGVTPAVKEYVDIKAEDLKVSKEPSVKYRGIFINDEWPAFGNWATKRFGGVNAACYAEVFEMLLRLKGNYFWPAMWASVFSDDGPGLKSAILADELGIVMSTSHHEPCMRAGEEYSRVRGPESVYGDAWDFISNREGIIRFWEDGLKRNGRFENVITMGMRGERDTAIMGNATLAENIALLKDIIKTQNDLIRKHVNPDLTKVPRQIVLFTEVEKFYYGDENTPGLIDDPELDGITIMFSDNNHGYMRTLPTERMRDHKGGYGMYYHVDMHGGSYSYEWIGSTYLPRIQDQMLTAYDFGVKEIWVVNVGDIMTQELEISFLMDMAYDMDKFGRKNLNAAEGYVKGWIEEQFGCYFNDSDKGRIFDIIMTYTKILERRRHEIMNEKIYHPVHFGETYDLISECGRAMTECDRLLKSCPEKIKTGFYELVYYPAYGTLNLMKAWAASTLNRYMIEQNRNTANLWNDVIDKCIEDDKRVVDFFHTIADGKFYGQGLSEHFGFRSWNDNNNQLPLKVYCYPANNRRLLISKKDETWYLTGREYFQRSITITDFLRPDRDEIILELSCASRDEVSYKIHNDAEWLSFSKTEGTTRFTDEIKVTIDRNLLTHSEKCVVRITGEADIFVDITFMAVPKDFFINLIGDHNREVFVGIEGYTVMEAEHYASKHDTDTAKYELLKPYGVTGSAMKLFPNTVDAETLNDKPALEYKVYVQDEGDFDAEFVFAATTPVSSKPEQSYSVSVNGGEPVKVNTVWDTKREFHNSPQWSHETKTSTKKSVTKLHLSAGINTIRYCQLSPNLILERIVVAADIKNVPESYLGPLESYRV